MSSTPDTSRPPVGEWHRRGLISSTRPVGGCCLYIKLSFVGIFVTLRDAGSSPRLVDGWNRRGLIGSTIRAPAARLSVAEDAGSRGVPRCCLAALSVYDYPPGCVGCLLEPPCGSLALFREPRRGLIVPINCT